MNNEEQVEKYLDLYFTVHFVSFLLLLYKDFTD